MRALGVEPVLQHVDGGRILGEPGPRQILALEGGGIARIEVGELYALAGRHEGLLRHGNVSGAAVSAKPSALERRPVAARSAALAQPPPTRAEPWRRNRQVECRQPCGERLHHGPPLGRAHRCPSPDLVERPPATHAEARGGIDGADMDARALGNLHRADLVVLAPFGNRGTPPPPLRSEALPPTLRRTGGSAWPCASASTSGHRR